MCFYNAIFDIIIFIYSKTRYKKFIDKDDKDIYFCQTFFQNTEMSFCLSYICLRFIYLLPTFQMQIRNIILLVPYKYIIVMTHVLFLGLVKGIFIYNLLSLPGPFKFRLIIFLLYDKSPFCLFIIFFHMNLLHTHIYYLIVFLHLLFCTTTKKKTICNTFPTCCLTKKSSFNQKCMKQFFLPWNNQNDVKIFTTTL